jgi:hypothetical protein
MGDTYKTSRSGMPCANGQIECHADHADAGQNSLLPGQTVDLVLYPDGNSTGNERISLTAQITGRSRSGAIDAIQPHTFNYSLSEGTVTFDTVP